MFHSFLIRNLGAYYMVLGSFYFALTGAFAKALSSDMSSVEVAFFRNIVGLILILLAIYKNPPINRGGRGMLLFMRGFIGSVSMLAFFYNIANIGLAESFTFAKTAPMFLALFGVLFFKEKLSFEAWIGIFLGFLGIVLIMQPNLGFSKYDFMGLFNGFLAAVAYMSVHELRRAYDTKTIVLSFMLSGTIIPLACMIAAEFFAIPSYLDFMFAKFTMPCAKMWIFIVLMGIGGILFQTYMTKAYAASKHAGVVAAVGYCDIIFTLILGLFMGDSLPNLMAFLGIVLVVVSGIMVVLKE